MITTKSMSGTESNLNLVNRQLNQPNQSAGSDSVGINDTILKGSDKVTLSETILRKPLTIGDDMNQQDAISLSLLVAEGLKKLSFGISSRAGVDVLRSF